MREAARLQAIREAVQHDVGGRGLARDPAVNLFTACADDLAAACHLLAGHPAPVLGVVTGFYIPAAGHGETDGPLGAVYLARTLPALGIGVQLVTDPFCEAALRGGLRRCGAASTVPVVTLPDGWTAADRADPAGWWRRAGCAAPTHLLAIERVGPAGDGRCYSMRGIDISERMRDATPLFASRPGAPPVTLGIGDGGNEIGMGRIDAALIAAHIPRGEQIACRLATDRLIVVGVSNWGAYALTAGVAVCRGVRPPADWFDAAGEHALLAGMVEDGPLVDGVSGRFTPTVDGLSFDDYIVPLRRLGEIVRS